MRDPLDNVRNYIARRLGMQSDGDVARRIRKIEQAARPGRR